MDLQQCVILAEELISKHGLTGWSFEFDRSRVRFGACCFDQYTISLSRYFVELNTRARCEETILHEIAHALVGVQAGHGELWKAKAVELGCPPERYFSRGNTVMPPMKYVAFCPNGHYSYRRSLPNPQNLISCGSCYRGFNPKYLLFFKLNPDFK